MAEFKFKLRLCSNDSWFNSVQKA